MTDTEFLKSSVRALDLVEMLSCLHRSQLLAGESPGGLEWTLFSHFLIVVLSGTCSMYGLSTQHVRGRDH